jgi:hypothetical protein
MAQAFEDPSNAIDVEDDGIGLRHSGWLLLLT